MNISTLILLILAIVFNALANVFVKASAYYGKNDTLLRTITNVWLLSGLISFGLAFLLYRYVLKEVPLSIAYPVMTSAGFAIVLGISRFLFQEKLVFIQWIGIGFLVVGIWLIASRWN